MDLKYHLEQLREKEKKRYRPKGSDVYEACLVADAQYHQQRFVYSYDERKVRAR